MENITIIVVKPNAPPSVKKPYIHHQVDMKESLLQSKMLLIPRMMPSDTVVIPPVTSLNVKQEKNTASLKKINQDTTLGIKFFSAGIAACLADALTFPLDTAKVRLQIQGELTGFLTGAQTSTSLAKSAATSRVGAATALQYHGIIGTLCTVARKEGYRAWYQGLTAGLQRQMCFASVRIGLYDLVKTKYSKYFGVNPENTNVGIRILAGLTTGSMAVLCAQPTDVVKTRLQAQTVGKKRYQGALHAYRTIAAQEGVAGLWKGLAPNVARNSIVNVTELVSYDLIKESILHHRMLPDTMPCHFVSAVGAGICTTVLASPVDVVKTRFMNSSPGVYRGALHCASQMYSNEGLKSFYKGCMPSFMRLTCWSILMFVSYEQVKQALTNIKMKDHTIITGKVKPIVDNISLLRIL